MFTVRRSGFTTANEIGLAIIKDLVENGFEAIYPQAWTPPQTVPATLAVTLEATGAVDPLNKADVTAKQPWRVRFEIYDAFTMGISVGSNLTLRQDGSDSWDVVSNAIQGPIGVAGARYTGAAGSGNTLKKPSATISEGFINRSTRVKAGAVDMSSSFPMSYVLTITNRGFILSVWEDILGVESVAFNWICVQRPVDRKTGETIVSGKAPVFCVNSVGNKISRFTVRESDVARPSISVDATVDTVGYNAIINKEEQVAISEGNKYIVNLPSRLNTQRYAYTYELDLFGYTGADVVSENNQIPFEIFGENRVYTTIHSNGPNNTKMRIAVLTSEPEDTPPSE